MSLIEMETNHGKRSIIYEYFTYRLDHNLREGNISWRCTHKRCKARIRTNGALTEVLQRKHEHNHETDERKIERQILRVRSKRKAVEDANEKLSKIVCSELENVDKQFLHPTDLRNVTKAMYRERRKHGIGRTRDIDRNGISATPKLRPAVAPKPRPVIEKNSNPDLSDIKVEPVDVDELLENDQLEVSIHLPDGRQGQSGGDSREQGRKEGQNSVDIMKLIQGAHERFEIERVDQRMPDPPVIGVGGIPSGRSHIKSSTVRPSGDRRDKAEERKLQQLMQAAKQNCEQLQQAEIIGVTPMGTPPPDVTVQALHSQQEMGAEQGVKLTDPYSLLASGGMTVEDFELQEHNPNLFRHEQKKQQRETTEVKWEQQLQDLTVLSKPKGVSPRQSPVMHFKPLNTHGSCPELANIIGGSEMNPGQPVELLTPSYFERLTSASSKQKDYTTPLYQSSSTSSTSNALSFSAFSDLSSPPSPTCAPLTRQQFQQALIHMIKTDTEFVDRLHDAYFASFQQRLNIAASKR